MQVDENVDPKLRCRIKPVGREAVPGTLLLSWGGQNRPF